MIPPLLICGVLALASPAWPCSVLLPLPSAEWLVGNAEVIARVRAEGLSSTPGRAGVLAGSRTQVTFAIVELLKGRLSSTRSVPRWIRAIAVDSKRASAPVRGCDPVWWLRREHEDVLVFVREENRVLKARLEGRRLRLDDGERRRLAELGHRLGRRCSLTSSRS